MELPEDAVDVMTRKTLARWRRQAPETAEFVPFVSPAVAAAGFCGTAAEAAWDATREVVEILRAKTLVLRTPSSFRPTAENKARFRAFWDGRLPEGVSLAWWPEGLWDGQPEVRDEICTELGLIPVVDPVAMEDDDPMPSGPAFYWRLRGGKGLQPGFTDYQLDQLMHLAAERERGHVVFTDAAMNRDAQNFVATWRMMHTEQAD